MRETARDENVWCDDAARYSHNRHPFIAYIFTNTFSRANNTIYFVFGFAHHLLIPKIVSFLYCAATFACWYGLMRDSSFYLARCAIFCTVGRIYRFFPPNNLCLLQSMTQNTICDLSLHVEKRPPKGMLKLKHSRNILMNLKGRVEFLLNDKFKWNGTKKKKKRNTWSHLELF